MENKDMITVYDRHFLDDYVFAELHSIKQNISMYNSLTYQAVYKELLEKMAKMDARPDYFVMLKAPLDTVLGRLRSRGREEEAEVDLEY
jgi:deoxyadenosine/deoxycytidine kinase